MFVTIIAARQGTVQVHQIEAPTVKDCLVAWAGRVEVEGLTDEGRTRLRGDMADFDQSTIPLFENAWKLRTDLGLPGGPEASVVVVETVRRG